MHRHRPHRLYIAITSLNRLRIFHVSSHYFFRTIRSIVSTRINARLTIRRVLKSANVSTKAILSLSLQNRLIKSMGTVRLRLHYQHSTSISETFSVTTSRQLLPIVASHTPISLVPVSVT